MLTRVTDLLEGEGSSDWKAFSDVLETFDGNVDVGIRDERETDIEKGSQKSSEKVYTCNECDFSSHHKFSLSRHMRKHMGIVKTFVCTVCNFALRTASELNQHTKLVHGEGLICPYCSKRFTSRTGYSSHIAREEGRFNYKCEFCTPNKFFLGKTHYECHMNMHTNQKPYKCVSCGKGFAHTNKHREHQEKCLKNMLGEDNVPEQFRIKRKEPKVVSARKKYRCEICSEEFAYAQNFHKHMAAHDTPVKAEKSEENEENEENNCKE